MTIARQLLTGISLAATGIALSATAAIAQEAAGAEAGNDIVVTARRSSERLQDIPLAITTQTNEQLQSRGVSDLEGVARFTPGLQFKDFVTTFHGNATLRGLSQINTSNPVGNVGAFIDGVYLQRGYMVDTSLGDFARVEVVKGPQSALYGQNTFAGAINYVTNNPTEELKADISGTFGNYGRRELQVGVGGPIIQDILGFRAYLGKSVYGGSWKNNVPQDAGDLRRFGGYDREAWSGKLVFTPVDGLRVSAFYQENRRSEELRPYYTLDGTFVEDKLNCGPVNTTTRRPSLFCGAFPVNPAAFRSGVGSPPETPFAVQQPDTITKTQVANVSVDYDFNDQLAAHYVYGWARGEAQEDIGAFSNTFNPTGRTSINYQHEGGVLNYRSHELRLAYTPSSALALEGGYFRSKARDRFVFGFNFQPPGRPTLRYSASDPLYRPSTFTTLQNFDARYSIDSVFGRATVKLLDEKLTLGAEGRYSWTDINFIDNQQIALGALKSKYNTFSPRFTANYNLTSSNMVYYSVAKGIKNGGFNGRQTGTIVLTQAEQSYGEEANWTYELGTKNSFMGGALIANVTLFYIDWNKKQNSVQPSNYVPTGALTPGTVPPNIYQTNGSATSYGIEIEGLYRPVDGLTINYSASWMKPTYDKGTIAAQFVGLCTGAECPVSANIGGNDIERTSRLSGALGAEYKAPISGEWDGFVGGDVTYQSKQYGDAVNISWIKSFAVANGRIGVSNDKYRVWLWANNLFDKKYIQSVFVIQNTRNNQAAYGERRTIGVTAAANF
jgi:iron complex outermembrane receptor protein